MFDNSKIGIGKIYKGEILSIIATIIAIFSAAVLLVFSSAANNGEVKFIDVISTCSLIFAGVIAVIAYVLNFLGIRIASTESEDFRNALYLTIAALIASLLSTLFETRVPGFANILEIAKKTCEMLAAYFVITGCIGIAKKLSNAELEQYGQKTLKLYLTVWIISVVLNIFESIFSGKAVFAGIIGIGALILTVVSYVVYLRLLKKTIEAL